MLKGKNVVITGAAKGIGKSILEKLAKNGANIWACARKKNEEFEKYIEKIRVENGCYIKEIYFDLNDRDQLKKGMKEILAEADKIDVLINNAGMVPDNAIFQMTTIETMKRVFDVNFFAHMEITQYILKKMTRQRYGNIINITSIAGIDGKPGQLEYAASKAALISATKTLAIELSPYNIRVNAIAPGITNTDMILNMNQELKETTLKNILMKRTGEPEEIANAVLFLASELSSYITGQVIRVDGGVL